MNMTEFNPFVRYIDKREGFFTGEFGNYAYDYRLFYISKGSAVLYVDGTPNKLKHGEMAIIPPGVLYKSAEGENACAFVVNMDLCFENTDEPPTMASGIKFFRKEKILSKTTCDLIPYFLKCNDGSEEMLGKVLKLYIEKPQYYSDRMSALIKTLVLDAMEYTVKDNSPELVKDVKQYLEENYSENITNKEIGDVFSYHPNHINRLFKKSTGETIHSYITKTRLKMALHMILESNFQIAEISDKCGFSSYAYFIKCFREKYGVSPLKYRNQRKKA